MRGSRSSLEYDDIVCYDLYYLASFASARTKRIHPEGHFFPLSLLLGLGLMTDWFSQQPPFFSGDDPQLSIYPMEFYRTNYFNQRLNKPRTSLVLPAPYLLCLMLFLRGEVRGNWTLSTGPFTEHVIFSREPNKTYDTFLLVSSLMKQGRNVKCHQMGYDIMR